MSEQAENQSPDQNAECESTKTEPERKDASGNEITGGVASPDSSISDQEQKQVLTPIEQNILQVIEKWDIKAPGDEGYSHGLPKHANAIYHAIAPELNKGANPQ